MDDWNTKQHNKSGLVDRVLSSPYTYSDAEKMTIEFLETYLDPNCSPMCGSGICQDRRFLARCMPKLESLFHYRNLDVSSIKELVTRWYPSIKFKKAEPASAVLLFNFNNAFIFAMLYCFICYCYFFTTVYGVCYVGIYSFISLC